MDIEQLQLILEAAKAAGEGAYSVVIIWFVYKFFGLTLHYGVIGGLSLAIYKFAIFSVKRFSFSSRIGQITNLDFDYSSYKNQFEKWLIENWREE